MCAASSWRSASLRCSCSAGRARLGARLLDLRAEAELHLAGGLLGEGDGDERAQRGLARSQEREDALDERGGLAGAGRGLDDERGVEIVRDARAGLVIDELCDSAHFCLRSSRRGFRRSFELSLGADLLVGTAHRLEVAVAARVLRGRGREEAGGDGVADRLRHEARGGARVVVQRDVDLREVAGGRAVVEAALLHLAPGEELLDA